MNNLKELEIKESARINGGYTCPFGDYSSRNLVKVIAHAVDSYRRRKLVMPLERVLARIR